MALPDSIPADRARIHQPGDVLAGRYRLVELLGEGGMGYVWEGRQITTDKAVAIKVLKSESADDAARLLREARLSASLTHPNIVEVFDFWEPESGGPVFMVMELLRGESLGAYLERARHLSIEEARTVGLAVALAMRAAHAKGIVHRDLKPDNVFLAQGVDESAPDIKVVDFGIARPTFADAALGAVTRTGNVIGTPYYMAPEQIFGEKQLDGAVDVWALGVVLYECLAGRRPFDGENFGQIFRQVTQHDAAPLPDHVPAPLRSLVRSMMARDRAARPTAAAVYETLRAAPDSAAMPSPAGQFTQRLPTAPPHPSPRRASPLHGVASGVRTATAPLGPSPSTPPAQAALPIVGARLRARAGIIAVVAVGLAAAGVVGMVMSSPPRATAPAAPDAVRSVAPAPPEDLRRMGALPEPSAAPAAPEPTVAEASADAAPTRAPTRAAKPPPKEAPRPPTRAAGAGEPAPPISSPPKNPVKSPNAAPIDPLGGGRF